MALQAVPLVLRKVHLTAQSCMADLASTVFVVLLVNAEVDMLVVLW